MPILNCYMSQPPAMEVEHLKPPIPFVGDDILALIYEVNPVTGLPRNDLSLIENPSVPPEVQSVLGQLHRSVVARDVYKTDKQCLNSVIPRSFQDQDVLRMYFKNIGLDEKVIDRALDGDSVNEV